MYSSMSTITLNMHEYEYEYSENLNVFKYISMYLTPCLDGTNTEWLWIYTSLQFALN